VKLGGVRVRPATFIVADDNGTVVIPMEKVARCSRSRRR
jgi:regulator of RNase E activity RraA